MNVPVFTVSPDPTCMYLTPRLRDGVAKIRRAITLRQGLCCVFGDNGFGKSSLLRHIAGALAADPSYRVALLAESTDAARFAFLRSIAHEFDLPAARSSIQQISAIEDFLLEQYDAKTAVVIMVDEAQLMRLEALEAIRSLLNFETHKEKLVQVVLAGQLEFRDRMFQRRYKPFRSRIVAPVVLEVFTPEETAAMIQFRHDYWTEENRFTPDATARVHEITKGVPRDIVVLCGYALSESDASGKGPITAESVDRAAQNLHFRSDNEVAA